MEWNQGIRTDLAMEAVELRGVKPGAVGAQPVSYTHLVIADMGAAVAGDLVGADADHCLVGALDGQVQLGGQRAVSYTHLEKTH